MCGRESREQKKLVGADTVFNVYYPQDDYENIQDTYKIIILHEHCVRTLRILVQARIVPNTSTLKKKSLYTLLHLTRPHGLGKGVLHRDLYVNLPKCPTVLAS